MEAVFTAQGPSTGAGGALVSFSLANIVNIKRVDRLVAMSVLGSLLMVWLVLTGFDAVTQFLRQLSHVGKNGFTLGNAVVYVLVTFPRRAYEMFGNSALIGGLLGLGGLAGTGELTALRAAGMSRMRIAGVGRRHRGGAGGGRGDPGRNGGAVGRPAGAGDAVAGQVQHARAWVPTAGCGRATAAASSMHAAPRCSRVAASARCS